MTITRGRLLVTGASGFLGKYLFDYAMKAGYEVWQLSRHPHGERSIHADLVETGDWQQQVRHLAPASVIHLSGYTRCQDVEMLYRLHVEGTRNLIAALDGTQAWLAIASSGAVYGEAKGNESLPWRETSICHPLGAYAESKLAQEALAAEVTKHGATRLCIARIANLVGPGQSEEFVLGRMVNSIVRFGSQLDGPNPVLETGSLAATRDFIDVRDAADALLALLSSRAQGIFNIASGKETSLRDVAKYCISQFGARVSLQENPNLHVSPISRQVLDNSALAIATGWRPAYPLQQTVGDMADNARLALAS